MGKLRKAPRSSSTTATGTGTGTPPHSPLTATTSTATATAAPSHPSTSRGSAPIPLRSAAHLNAPVALSETVVAALDDVDGGPTSTSTSPGALTAAAAAWPPSASSTSSPSSPRLYRTRIASTSTIASQDHETHSTMSTSSGSAGSALSKLRSRLELDQAAREEAATRATAAKLRKPSSRRPVSSAEVADHLGESTMAARDEGVVAVAVEADAHEAHDPPDLPLEHLVPEGVSSPHSVPVQPLSHEVYSSAPVQLPEQVLAPVAEPPPPAPELVFDLEPNRRPPPPPPPPAPRSLSSSSATSLLFAPIRLGWRVTTAPARMSYRLAAFGVGVVGSGISLGQKVALLGFATATEAGHSLGNAVAAKAATSNGRVSGTKSENRQTALLRLRDTVSPARIALAALQVSLGVALASVLVARALVELAVTKVRNQAMGGRVA